MVCYRIIADSDVLYDFKMLDFDESKLPFGRYDVNSGKAIDADSIYIDSILYEGIFEDWITNTMGFLIVNNDLAALIKEYEIGETQFIPVLDKNNGTDRIGYLLNIINHVDALDVKNSTMMNKRDKTSVIKYALLADKIGNRDLFCLIGNLNAIFISERLAKKMKESKITGCYYQKIKVT